MHCATLLLAAVAVVVVAVIAAAPALLLSLPLPLLLLLLSCASRTFLYTMMLPLACPAKNCVPLLLGTHSRTLHLLLSCMLSVLSCAAMIGRLFPAGACSCARSDISITACSGQQHVLFQGQQTAQV